MGDKDQDTGGSSDDQGGAEGPPGAGGGDDRTPPVGVFLAGAAVGFIVGFGVNGLM